MRINDGGDGVGGIVESVYEFKSQRHEQREAQQEVWKHGSYMQID
jgi:hypothetical protein